MRKQKRNMIIKAIAKSDIGRVRDENQDRVRCVPQSRLYELSDGMGGVIEGAKTAEMVTDTMPDVANKILKKWVLDKDVKKAALGLKSGLEVISDYIYNNGNAEGYSMYGATYVGVMVLGDKLVWVNIGDSRGYAISDAGRTIKQVTKDHNLAQIAFDAGRFTREELKGSPLSSQLTRFVGMKAPAQADVYITDINEQENIILCSDGLYGQVSDEEIRQVVQSHKSAKKICDILIKKANARGGRDNISVLYIE
ncbi:MAG: serine/threonine-protein phosphatase, partial [Clostridia bacterium]|nr:serine/threonine-protein phosphatase [Clostridia bacterium]